MRELTLVRHGETVGESSSRLYGMTDIELSDTGREQMRRCGVLLKDIPFASAFVSPLRRSRESAAIALNGNGPAPTVVEEFREINFGRWEGWTLDEANERDPETYARWKSGALEFQFPDGDDKMAFFSRVAETARRIFDDAPSPIIAVLHKGVIKGVLNGLLGFPIERMTEIPVELGGVHRLVKRDGEWSAATQNEIEHLKEMRIPHSR